MVQGAIHGRDQARRKRFGHQETFTGALRHGSQPDEVAQAGDENGTDGGLTSSDKPDSTDGDHAKAVDQSIVVAEHVMLLLGGKEIVTWDDIENKLAALPDPSKAVPHFYFTNGVIKSGDDQAAKSTIYNLRRQYKFTSYSEGTLLPRAGCDMTASRNRAISSRMNRCEWRGGRGFARQTGCWGRGGTYYADRSCLFVYGV